MAPPALASAKMETSDVSRASRQMSKTERSTGRAPGWWKSDVSGHDPSQRVFVSWASFYTLRQKPRTLPARLRHAQLGANGLYLTGGDLTPAIAPGLAHKSGQLGDTLVVISPAEWRHGVSGRRP